MIDWIAFSKYAGVLAALIAAGFGAPIPEEVPIVTAGVMVGHDAQERSHSTLAGAIGGGPAYVLTPLPRGLVRWYIMLPICIIGVVISDLVLYTAGRFFGDRILRIGWVQRRVITPEKRATIEENFRTRGILILLGARLTPGIRTPVFIMSGVLRLPLSRFLLADFLYAIPGINILFWLSYWFTDQFVEAMDAVERHRPMVMLVVLSAILGVIIYQFLNSRTISTGDPEKIPIWVRPLGSLITAVEVLLEKAFGKTREVIDKVSHPRASKQPTSDTDTDRNVKPSPQPIVEEKQPHDEAA